MASLQELLVEEGFERHRKGIARNQKKVKFRDRRAQNESIVLPIYICHERRKSFDASKQHKAYSQSGGSILSSSTRRGGSDSGRSVNRPKGGQSEPAIDDVAVKAVVSILGGYVGQYLRDRKFRESTREKCLACFTRESDSGDAHVHNMELGIDNVERLIEDHQENGEKLNTKSLQYCIWLFSTITTSVQTEGSQVSACAYLYLSVVYKIYRSDQTSARHLLQVFCESPHVARTHLLPDVWEHLFLPHLLHIKIWYTEEAESLLNSVYPDFEDVKMEALAKAYNEQTDVGTQKFALYYKEWLKDGAKAPAIPSVPLPSSLNRDQSRRRYSESFTTHSSTKSSLYQAIFGPIMERQSTKSNDKTGFVNHHSSSEEQKKYSAEEDDPHIERRSLGRETSSSISRRNDHKKSDYFRGLSCRADATETVVSLRIPSVGKERSKQLVPNEVSRAIRTICSSDSLNECEAAIRLITKALLNGDFAMENASSNAQLTEAILEVLSASSDDEVLELAISILAQLMTKEEANAKIILNFDPQLDIFLRLLRNNSLFLKAAVLLYLAKPKAKQMIAMEWIPLVLRVLEFGDQLQTLFSIQCRPQEAAYYFLHQLLNCFDEDKNMENAGYVVSLGGLNLLLRRMEVEDTCEMKKAASIIYTCIRADGSCRHYLAEKMKKEYLISLLLECDGNSPTCHGLALLTELFCLTMHSQRIIFLNELAKGWGGMSTMHILLAFLQRAQPQDRPMVAALLLQLDVLGDPDLLGSECSVYREEAVDGIVKALECGVVNERVQEECAKALLVLGGHFTYTGEPVAEKWLLKQAGFESFNEQSMDSFRRNATEFNEHPYLSGDEKAAEKWQRRMAFALLRNDRSSLLEALSSSMANGIPRLARASLATVCWISSFLQSFGDRSFQNLACCTLELQLLECLNYDKTVEERVLASFSLLSLLEGSDYELRSRAMICEELMEELEKLSHITWTAKRLISVIKRKLLKAS